VPFDLRFEPELRFSFRMMDVDVHARLLSREEVEAKAASPKYGRAHPPMLVVNPDARLLLRTGDDGR
jgi:hypothetical protein